MREVLIAAGFGLLFAVAGLALIISGLKTLFRPSDRGKALRNAIPPVLAGALFLGGGAIGIEVGIHRPAEEAKQEVAKRFIAAAGRGDIETVRRMLANQPDLVNVTEVNLPPIGQRVPLRRPIGAYGQIVNRPLQAAAEGLHADVVELLLDRGADVNATLANRVTALHAAGNKITVNADAASAMRSKVIELLIGRGANVNARKRTLQTPLHENVHDQKAVELLLAHGADVNARDDIEETPLLRAAAIPWIDAGVVRVLLDHGADIRARDHDGDTAFVNASINLEVLELLLSRGAAPKEANNAGDTALHRFAELGGSAELHALDPAAFLCSAGLRPDVRDRAGKTPADILNDRIAGESDSSRIVWLRRTARFLSAGGPCDQLARSSRPPSKEQRDVTVAEFACTNGDTEGCAKLAWSYDTGTGVPVNRSRAAQLYGPVCDAGTAWACFNLALLYAAGDGVSKDETLAMAFYRKACDRGDADACLKVRSTQR
ncbi:MAG TPA: ankyrin repeat domain-containing protein [Thermoanaerobaculia bacterium]|nr:ankyrin repeat domain-containing protein [Thermoanaerobaculia bacterium]